MQAAKARRDRRLLFRVLHRELAPEEILAGQAHAAEELGQEQAVDVFAGGIKHDFKLRVWSILAEGFGRASS